jgi:hypothetical protein
METSEGMAGGNVPSAGTAGAAGSRGRFTRRA